MAKIVNQTGKDLEFRAEGCEPDSGTVASGATQEIETGQTIYRLEIALKEVPGENTITISS
jgi:hypothetical protein